MAIRTKKAATAAKQTAATSVAPKVSVKPTRKPAAAKSSVLLGDDKMKAASKPAVVQKVVQTKPERAAKPVAESKSAAKPAVVKAVAKKAKTAKKAATAKLEVAAHRGAGKQQSVKVALNPTGAWPFPTGLRPK